MRSDVAEVDRDKMVSPHAQEVEFALILSRMIDAAKEDPAQMRLAIYEFARVRLKLDASWADEPERQRLSAALETAIQGVERFSTRHGDRERLQPPSSVQARLAASPAEPPLASIVTIHPVTPAHQSILFPGEDGLGPGAEPVTAARKRILPSTPIRLWGGIVLFAAVAGVAFYKQQTWPQPPTVANSPPPLASAVDKPAAPASIPDPPQQSPPAAETRTAAVSSGAPAFPLPSDYGVYAVGKDALSELRLLPEQVPDKRVAMSTPVSQPSRTTLADGRARFVVFRRDIAGNAPDRMDVRVVARVVRALTFDAKGKASFVPVSDAWNIRNKSYEFRVRPVAGNPEMLLVQPENADFALPPGRYVLVLRNQGYDFTVAGQVTDPAQCLERTDAANGAFYSDCQKP